MRDFTTVPFFAGFILMLIISSMLGLALRDKCVQFGKLQAHAVKMGRMIAARQARRADPDSWPI